MVESDAAHLPSGVDEPGAYNLPDWEQIETPWPAQPIVWRPRETYPYHLYHADLRAYASNPDYTHLVREVLISGSPSVIRKERSSLQARQQRVTWAQHELAELAELGLEQAGMEWFSYPERRGVIRTLARVVIVDGFCLDDENLSREQRAIASREATRITAIDRSYRRNRKNTLRLSESATPHQHMHGYPRVSPRPEAQTLLVDPDIIMARR